MPEQYELSLVNHSYTGEVIRQRSSDGYINATAMCRAEGKQWPEYRRLKSTEKFFNVLALDMGIPHAQLAISNLGSPGGDRKSQGTWVHPQVAIDLAQWLSPEFKIKQTRRATEYGKAVCALNSIPEISNKKATWAFSEFIIGQK